MTRRSVLRPEESLRAEAETERNPALLAYRTVTGSPADPDLWRIERYVALPRRTGATTGSHSRSVVTPARELRDAQLAATTARTHDNSAHGDGGAPDESRTICSFWHRSSPCLRTLVAAGYAEPRRARHT
ncbi:hypothetical protein GCM10018952_56720 [Streptosporangium vulgare]